MAEIKKPEINKAADTKTSTAATPVAAPAAKTEPAASTVKAEAKTETKAAKETKAPAEKKKPGRKPGVKKTGRKPAAAKKETAKSTTTKKTTKTVAAKKTAVKESLHLEFAGKSYTTEELVKIAKDVWKYDLKKKVGDFKSVELYVKPEESVVYYVINGDVAGNFGI